MPDNRFLLQIHCKSREEREEINKLIKQIRETKKGFNSVILREALEYYANSIKV